MRIGRHERRRSRQLNSSGTHILSQATTLVCRQCDRHQQEHSVLVRFENQITERMHKLFLLLFVTCVIDHANAQVLCVQCFEQNDSIGVNVGADNLIMNGGFENTNCATGCVGVYCPSSMSFNCSIANWTCTGGGTLTYACVYDSAHYMVIEGSRAAYFGNSYANPCSGDLSSTFPNNDTACVEHVGCEILGINAGSYPLSGPNYGGANGLSLAQTVTGLVPGNIYVVEFWAGGEYQGWFSHDGIFAVDVGFGKIFLKCRITHQLPDTGTRYLIQFIATSSSQTITFTNWGHVCGSCTEVVIDDVRLYDPSHLGAAATPCATSVNSINVQHAQVFSDPANHVLNVTMDNSALSEISLYDMISRKLIERSFVSTATFHLDALPQGVYAYAILNGGTITTGKFIKE